MENSKLSEKGRPEMVSFRREMLEKVCPNRLNMRHEVSWLLQLYLPTQNAVYLSSMKSLPRKERWVSGYLFLKAHFRLQG